MKGTGASKNPTELFHWLSDRVFCLVLLICALSLYSNTFSGGYVWDDRAAIISNRDVHGITSLSELFQNDFWGQNITLFDSHKSYRPITVLSFRLNHTVHGLKAAGFHIVNAIIYAFVCVIYYVWSLQWSSPSVSRTASLIFCFHPVHVEAVASLVGRADSLCGLFYLLSLVFYTDGLRGGTRSAATIGLSFSYVFALCACFSKEIGATVFGVLIFLELAEIAASLLPMNAQDGIILVVSNRKGDKQKQQKEHNNESFSFVSVWSRIIYKCVTSGPTILRLFTSTLGLSLIMAVRLRINGTHSLYQWTVLENHISILPTFKERLLSYSQTHFWYIFKMIFPRYLCFDYGFYCIPTVHDYFDWRNILPLSTYIAIVSLTVFAFVRMRLTYLVGLLLLLMPLVPALNMLFPVGTVLAERLMFIPSIGFSIIVAELLLIDFAHVWMQLSGHVHKLQVFFDGKATAATARAKVTATAASSAVRRQAKQLVQQSQSHKDDDFLQQQQRTPSTDSSDSRPSTISNKSGGSGRAGSRKSNDNNGDHSSTNITTAAAAYKPSSAISRFLSLFLDMNTSLLFLLPVIALFACRVISRNRDWNSEIRIYKSALEVCPLSVKALTNYASLTLSEGRQEEAVLAAETAVALYIGQRGAYVNLGIAYDRSQQPIKAIRVFEKALKLYPGEAKLYGYLGGSLFRWASSPFQGRSNSVGTSSSYAVYRQVASALRKKAASYLDQAIIRGFDAPAILHTRGSLAIDENDNNAAAFYLNQAIHKMEALQRMSRDVPMNDVVEIALTCNQLGTALWNANRPQEAEAAFERGLSLSPRNHALRTNLGSLYRASKRNDLARIVMQDGINISLSDEEEPSPALLNNLGLLEFDEGNYDTAISLFEQAVAQVTSAVSSLSEMRAPDGGDVVEMMKNNIARARQGLLLSQSPRT